MPSKPITDITTEEKLQERIKELTCLYEISNALLGGGSVTDAFLAVTTILKDAWRFQWDAVAEIKLDDIHVYSNPIPFESVFQEEALEVFGQVRGYVRVHYAGSHYAFEHFLEDERLLLRKVADELSSFYERGINDKKIEVLQKKAEQAHRLSVLGEITAGIAHELNTPLGNILGFAELLSQNSTNPKNREDAAKVVKAAVFAREIVKKLMFFACDMPQNFHITEVKPVIGQAIALLEPNFRKAGVEYDFICKDNIVAQLDSLQLTQIMFNLLVNAIHFSPKGGCVTITAFSTPDELIIEVSDNGPGIPEENRSRIFDPFFTTKPVGEGSGLGLSVVHGIVRSHRGDIAIFDNLPTGTVFRVRLPLKQS